MFWDIFIDSLVLIIVLMVIGQGIAKVLSSHEEKD
jgi:hypothetical protein